MPLRMISKGSEWPIEFRIFEKDLETLERSLAEGSEAACLGPWTVDSVAGK